VYNLIILVAVGAAGGRICSTQLVYEPSLYHKEPRRFWPKSLPPAMPTFGSNDRSRWATVRALVENGTYVIGRRDRAVVRASAVAPLGELNALQAAMLVQAGYRARIDEKSNQGVIFEPGYESVDKVLHPETLDFFSSKPPFLATLAAGLYWLLHALGFTMSTSPNLVVRSILFLINVIPFAIYLHLLGGWLERWSTNNWAKLFVFVAAAFGTLVSPFLVTLNNHAPATFAVLFALHGTFRIGEARQAGRTPRPHWFVIAGFFAAFAAALEMPALALVAALGFVLLLWAPLFTLVFFLGAALVPAAAFLQSNYHAVGQFRPVQSEFDGAVPWYQYEGSHWRRPLPGEPPRPGIDWARYKESRFDYAFHVLLGHHGWFSLTPIWLLALVPMFRRSFTVRIFRGDDPTGPPPFLPPLAFAVSIVVIGFYLVTTDNYGGYTVGLRWLMWLTPLWLICLLPAAERLAVSRLGRCTAGVLLAISVLSANYSPWNPWRHPWLYDLFVACGWHGY
jgi:hypothetical protein